MIELGPGAAIGDGRYRLERLLGAGGMASVWLARDDRLDRLVAVKVMSDSLAADPSYARRFEREARTAAGLSHPNLVRVFDYETDGARPALVMEYVEGGTLAALAEGRTRTSIDQETLARELLEALAHVHEAGIVHRDVKPANVLVGRDGRARLTDFGIAQPEDATRLTQVGAVIGTIKYLAPEVIQGADASPASDLYAAGVVLRECAGESPPARLARLVERLTEAEPERRPSSARAALGELGDRPRSHASGTAEAATSWVDLAAERTRTLAADASEPASVRRPRELRPHLDPTLAKALLALAGLLVMLAVLVSAGGGEEPSRAPAAARDAPLERQLDALDRAVREAAR